VRFFDRLRSEFSFFQGNYLILILSWILMDFAGELAGAYYSKFVEKLGATESIIGFIGLSSLLALALVQFPGGYLADRGRKWLVSTMTFGVALSYIFYIVAPSWHFILIGSVIGNLCLIYQPALLAMMSDALPPERRGMGFSIINLIMSVATTPAPAVALLLVTYYGFMPGMRIAYILVTSGFIVAALVRLLLKESIKNAQKIKPSEFISSYPKALKEGIAVWKLVPRSMFFLFLSSLLVRFSFALVQLYFIQYALKVLQIGDEAWGLALTLLFLTMIVASFPCGKILDKIGRKVPLLISIIIVIPAVLLFLYGGIIGVFIAMPLTGLSQLLSMSAYMSLQADLVPKEQRGKVIGSSNFFNYIFMAFGSLAGGVIYERISPQLPFLIMIALAIPSLCLTLYLVEESGKREE